MLQVRFVCRITNTCPGVYRGLFVSKNSPEKIQRHITNTDKIQQNAHGHSTLPTRSFIHHSFIRSFIHSFVHSFIHSFILITPLMHHPCITHSSHTASYYASPIHRTASQRIIPCIIHSSHCIWTHHTGKTLYTTNHTDKLCSECITTLMHYNDNA